MKKINTKYESKLNFNRLWIQTPVNAKAWLSQNERDFLDTLIHLQNLKKQYISDSMIIANSGLSNNKLQTAKKHLKALGLIETKHYKSTGTLYIINRALYEDIIDKLNAVGDAAERFSIGDAFRKDRGLDPIFKNIINTIKRKIKASSLLGEGETIYAMQPIPTKTSLLEKLEAEYNGGDGSMRWDVYDKKKQTIINNNF